LLSNSPLPVEIRANYPRGGGGLGLNLNPASMSLNLLDQNILAALAAPISSLPSNVPSHGHGLLSSPSPVLPNSIRSGLGLTLNREATMDLSDQPLQKKPRLVWHKPHLWYTLSVIQELDTIGGFKTEGSETDFKPLEW
jgi:hypothetical protein